MTTNCDIVAASSELLEQLRSICEEGTVLGAPLTTIGRPARELVADAEEAGE